MKPPRDVISWDDYFLRIAEVVSIRSKDPDTQIGCVVVDPRRTIVATGYNGPPPGADDYALDWSRPAKYGVILHAEANAIARAGRPLAGCTVYVTGHPCSACVRLMAAAGIVACYCGSQPITMMDESERALAMRIARMVGLKIYTGS